MPYASLFTPTSTRLDPNFSAPTIKRGRPTQIEKAQKEERMRTRHERQVTDKPFTKFEMIQILREELFITTSEAENLLGSSKIQLSAEQLTRIVNCFHEIPAQAYMELRAKYNNIKEEKEELEYRITSLEK